MGHIQRRQVLRMPQKAVKSLAHCIVLRIHNTVEEPFARRQSMVMRDYEE